MSVKQVLVGNEYVPAFVEDLGDPKGSKAITVTTTATLLSALVSGGIPSGARWAYLQPRTGSVYFTDLSTDTPTTSGVGIEVAYGVIMPIYNLTSVKLIADADTTATVQFYS